LIPAELSAFFGKSIVLRRQGSRLLAECL
jgi:hypothetical protein